MLTVLNTRLNLFCITLFAVILQIVIYYWSSTNQEREDDNFIRVPEHLHIDAKSAINRAKTLSCKQEILKYAIEQARQNSIVTYLKNYCESETDTKQSTPLTKPVTIAFLLSLNGRSVQQIRRLLKLIYSKNHIYYLHVDARQQYLFNKLVSLQTEHDNIIVTERRRKTIWGGTALLQMILDAIQNISHRNWDFILNLSESDFPLRSLKELELYLESKPRTNIYLKTHNLTNDKFIKKQGLDQSFYQCEDRVWRLGFRNLPKGITYSGGSDWFVLPKDFCDFILNERNKDEELVKPLSGLYNHTLLPAESFFHTIALNSRFCTRIVDSNLRVTNWQRKVICSCQHRNIVDWCGCSPLVYRMSDLERLRRARSLGSIFFSRKFDPTISSSIIAAVEQQLNLSKPISSYDSRFWLNLEDFDDGLLTKKLQGANEQFGMIALAQVLEQNQSGSFRWMVKSTDAYFDQDKFIGLIYRYCDAARECMQILIRRNVSAHLIDYNSDCFQDKDHQIKVIEVSHGFDTRERLFRNYKPISARSDVVVYHEWVVQDVNYNKTFEFRWFGPSGQTELLQKIKLKKPSTPAHLSLVHRLNIKKPLSSGLWKLSVFDGLTKCFSYRFLVFNENSFSGKTQEQVIFDKFYQVIGLCSERNNNSECERLNWTLHSKTRLLATYDL